MASRTERLAGSDRAVIRRRRGHRRTERAPRGARTRRDRAELRGFPFVSNDRTLRGRDAGNRPFRRYRDREASVDDYVLQPIGHVHRTRNGRVRACRAARVEDREANRRYPDMRRYLSAQYPATQSHTYGTRACYDRRMETGVSCGEKRNTKRKGDISELRVMLALVAAGYRVAIPFGEDQRYELIIEKDNVLSRVQVKTGRLRKGVVLFNCFSSHTHRGGAACRMYTGEVEYFGVYCPDTDSVYLLPLADIAVQRGTLRVVPAKHGQTKKMRWANDFLLEPGRDGAPPRSSEGRQLLLPS